MSHTVPDHELHRVVATCIIYNQARRFLIGRRSPNLPVFPNKWGVPGGGLSRTDYEHLPLSLPDGWSNPLEIALRREIVQEMGVEVGPLSILGTFSHIRKDSQRPEGVAVLGVRYFAPYKKGKVVLKLDEFVEHKWVRIEDLPQYDFMGGIVDAIHCVDRILSYKDLGGAAH
jgi:8-oxo-dGTP pyrophosphatase MutT (NUDIX family)